MLQVGRHDKVRGLERGGGGGAGRMQSLSGKNQYWHFRGTLVHKPADLSAPAPPRPPHTAKRSRAARCT